MNKENIKVGSIWIEDKKSIDRKISLLFFILIGNFLLLAINAYFFVISMTIYFIMFFYFFCNSYLPPHFDLTVISIHYQANVNLSKNAHYYTEIFDSIKKYYENENLNEKQEKYKFKDTIYLYKSNAENAKKWFEEQNEKIKIIRI